MTCPNDFVNPAAPNGAATAPSDTAAEPFALPQWPDAPPLTADQQTSGDQGTQGHGASGDEAAAGDDEAVTPPGAGDPSEQLVGVRLQQLAAGLGVDELNAWVDEFLGMLAGLPQLSRSALRHGVDRLTGRLTELGYPTLPRKDYLKRWKQLAKAHQAHQQIVQHAPAGDAPLGSTQASRFVIRAFVDAGAYDPKWKDPATGGRLATAPPLADFTSAGFYDLKDLEFLTNFTLLVHQEVDVVDDHERTKVLHGRINLFGRELPFEIAAADFADNNRLKAAITSTAGARAQFYGKTDLIRQAVSALSWQPGRQEPLRTTVTKNFGWDEAGETYLVPGGRVTAAGFEAVDDQAGLRVDLAGEELSRHLGMRALPPATLAQAKRGVVEDLLRLQDGRATYGMLGAVGVAVLGRFTDTPPFILWLLGLTGAGKSFLAKLFQNFFGDFPLNGGRFATWAATPNYLQRTGYFFKDALYLVDDYKPEVARHHDVVRVMQNYADRTGRGRLKADATTNTTRPIRGLLLATGEDVPEHTASALARNIIISVPQQDKDLARGQRCRAACPHYAGVTADFIRHVLHTGRTRKFARRVAALQRFYYRGIAGQQNDARIAGNFALLAAGFYELARYFADVWPTWRRAAKRFITLDLVEVRDEMLGTVKEQQASEVFWGVLRTLVEHDAVELDVRAGEPGKPVVGKPYHPQPREGVVGSVHRLVCVSTDLALAEVNSCLRAQGRPELRVTPAALIGQLRRDGKLLDEDGLPLAPEGSGAPTRQLRIDGKLRRSFITRFDLLVGDAERAEAQSDRNPPRSSPPAVRVAGR
ncbi:MAG: hypothetical protein JNM56_12985 [Planctomycetia bacterium]|nr:hypothetical protein [Planctomycetia bacterium]